MIKEKIISALRWIFVSYYRLKKYVSMGDFKKKHISIQREGTLLKFSIKSHVEYLVETDQKISKLSKKDLDKYVQDVLEIADGCNYITFLKGNFKIQFKIHRGKYIFFEIFPLKDLYRGYYLSILGLLAELNFIRPELDIRALSDSRPKHYHYKISGDSDSIEVEANFEKDIEKAALFASTMYSHVYKVKKGQIRADTI